MSDGIVLTSMAHPTTRSTTPTFPFPKPRSYVSKRRWKARYKMGRPIPVEVIFDLELVFTDATWSWASHTARRRGVP